MIYKKKVYAEDLQGILGELIEGEGGKIVAVVPIKIDHEGNVTQYLVFAQGKRV